MSEEFTPPGLGLDPEELAQLRETIRALRSDLQNRFGASPGGADAAGDAAASSVQPRANDELDPGPLESLVAAVRARVDTLLSDRGELDPMDLFERLRRRLSSLGMESRAGEVDEFGLDTLYLARVRALLDFLYDRWWAVQVSGADVVPDGGPVLFVANRSGVLPYDGLMIAHALARTRPSGRRPRFLVADWLVTLPFSQPALARLGGVRACPENAERLLAAGEDVVAFPEGQKGALKLFRDRYRLQRFGRGGFVSLALRGGASIVPVAVVGAEEAHPILLRPRLLQRLLGAPLPVTPTFPLLGPLGLVPLPSQWRIRFGEPIPVADLEKEHAEDPLYLNRKREQIRSAIQDLLDQELRSRGSVFSRP